MVQRHRLTKTGSGLELVEGYCLLTFVLGDRYRGGDGALTKYLLMLDNVPCV